MNEEEKKAIKRMKEFACTIYGTLSVKEAQIILNLIENQKAEIEKLRNNNKDLLRKLRNRVKEVKKLQKYSLYKKEFSTLNEHLKKKEKIIDLMAEEISENITNTCPFADYNYDLDCENKCNDNYKECWKQYFENKVKEVQNGKHIS